MAMAATRETVNRKELSSDGRKERVHVSTNKNRNTEQIKIVLEKEKKTREKINEIERAEGMIVEMVKMTKEEEHRMQEANGQRTGEIGENTRKSAKRLLKLREAATYWRNTKRKPESGQQKCR